MYRAWSHWRALNGGKHLQFLLKNNLLALSPSPILDEAYPSQKKPLPSSREPTTDMDSEPIDPGGLLNPEGETMLISHENGKKMAQALEFPELEVELERAIWQVEEAIKKKNGQGPGKEAADSPVQTAEHGTKHDEKRSP